MLRTAGDETSARISGPISVDDAGLIDAQLTMTLENPQIFAQIMAEFFPAARDQIRIAFMGVAMLGDTPSMPVRIEKGAVSIGFLRLGNIPPV